MGETKMAKVDLYPSQVFWSEEDEGYIALAPDLPGCSAFGETQAEAITELDHAKKAWFEAAEAAGNPIPEPSPPIPPESYSGKCLVRMPRTLHKGLADRARLEGVSLNQLMVFYLASGVSDHRSMRASSATGRLRTPAELFGDNWKFVRTQLYAGYEGYEGDAQGWRIWLPTDKGQWTRPHVVTSGRSVFFPAGSALSSARKISEEASNG